MATIVLCDFCGEEISPENRRMWQFGEPQNDYPGWTHYYDVCSVCLPTVKHEAQQMIAYIKTKEKRDR